MGKGDNNNRDLIHWFDRGLLGDGDGDGGGGNGDGDGVSADTHIHTHTHTLSKQHTNLFNSPARYPCLCLVVNNNRETNYLIKIHHSKKSMHSTSM